MKTPIWHLGIGANLLGKSGTCFRVWAPKAKTVAVRIDSEKMASYPLQEEGNGYFSATVAEAGEGDRYLYVLDDAAAFPDPASRYQPTGVHEPSQVVNPLSFDWHDEQWIGLPLEQYVIYEIHVGTFTPEGTFSAVIHHLDYLRDLGITALELMPVSQFPGERNWGYDGVHHFAPQSSYGGPEGMKELINACHIRGLAVILDVVYNHFGPEGNHMGNFGHYFTDKYQTPWGGALNFDGPYSDPVKEYFIDNALYWINEFHVDGLRLDAVDWIFDLSANHFLQQLAAEVHRQRVAMGRHVFLFAENDTNDGRLIKPVELGGYGLDAQWCDNFHHALRTLLTRETTGYYEDFGRFNQLVKAYQEAFVYTGEYSICRKKCHGNSVKERPTSQFIVFTQNHDQVGNRKCGDRLSADQPLEKLLLAAGVVLLSPYLPLIFMGEEYAEKAPFHYFVSHSDPVLIEAVRRGKAEEHASGICEGELPDPEAEAVFLESKLDHHLKSEGEHALILEFYRQLLALRKKLPALQIFQRERIEVTPFPECKTFAVMRRTEKSAVLCMFSFSNLHEEVLLPLQVGNWEKALDSSSLHWRGPGEIAPPTIAVSRESETIPLSINPFSLLVYSSATHGGSHGRS